MARTPASHTGDIAKAVEEKVTTSLKRTFSQMTQAINNLQNGKGKGKGKTEAKGKSKGKATKGKAKKGKGKGKGSKEEKGKDQKEKPANTTVPKGKEQKEKPANTAVPKADAKKEDHKGRMDMDVDPPKCTGEKLNTSLDELIKDDAKIEASKDVKEVKAKSKEVSSSSSSIDSEEERKIAKKHGLTPITKRQYSALRELTTDIHKALLADLKTGKQVNRNMLNVFVSKMAAVPLQ